MKNIIKIRKSVEIDTEVDVRLDLSDYKQELIETFIDNDRFFNEIKNEVEKQLTLLNTEYSEYNNIIKSFGLDYFYTRKNLRLLLAHKQNNELLYFVIADNTALYLFYKNDLDYTKLTTSDFEIRHSFEKEYSDILELIANNPANSTKRTLEKDDCSLLVLAMNKV
jgi:hypothetical protein